MRVPHGPSFPHWLTVSTSTTKCAPLLIRLFRPGPGRLHAAYNFLTTSVQERQPSGKMEMQRRPGFCTAGRAITVLANFFQVSVSPALSEWYFLGTRVMQGRA